jgi:tetratricopeptide (TPR) repeat protein
MPKLEPPQSYHLSAALGWLELGNCGEARAELDQLAEQWRDHPDVLELIWASSARGEQWEFALDIANQLVEKAPRRASGWLHRAYALRRAKGGGVEAAWNALLPAYKQFTDEATIPYNLSCYACQMRKLDEARTWLDLAVKAGGRKQIKAMALKDEDLEPLWPEIRRL